jgi:CrcB protein
VRALPLVGVGGAIGALARGWLGARLAVAPTGFPVSTFLVNVSGAFLLGLLLTLLVERLPQARSVRPLLGTGLLGAYTTFSALTVEAAVLAVRGRPLLAVGYVAGSLLAGMAAVAAGAAAVRRPPGRRERRRGSR